MIFDTSSSLEVGSIKMFDLYNIWFDFSNLIDAY